MGKIQAYDVNITGMYDEYLQELQYSQEYYDDDDEYFDNFDIKQAAIK